MGYVDKQLVEGERVVYATRLHKIALVVPGGLGGILVLVGLVSLATEPSMGWFFVLTGGLVIGIAWLVYKSSEFAVTDRRVIIKVGFITRRTVETLLTKVEGVQVDQGILGRMLDYGTISVVGTGGTKEQFKNIAWPLVFRQKVQEGASRGHASAAQEHLTALAGGGRRAPDGMERLERLVRLREQGALTPEEFEQQKRKILADG